VKDKAITYKLSASLDRNLYEARYLLALTENAIARNPE
jgi:hypothetical protein